MAQMYPDRHNTNSFDGWISCSPSQSPNEERGTLHWIMYDLGHFYQLGELKVWNSNIPDSTDIGIQNIILDYSLDGMNWTEYGEYTLSQGPASSIYEGEVLTDLNNTTVRYLLINASSNYGGTCYGLSEIRIGIGDAVVPVELVSFEVKCESSNMVTVSWETANELNNDYFLIQESTNGFDWFEAKKTSSKAPNNGDYVYEETIQKTNNAASYYRLIQVDKDGSQNVLGSNSVRCDEEFNSFTLSPNPASNKVMLSLGDQNIVPNSIKVFSLAGQQILSLSQQEIATQQIDVSNLSSGSYVVEIDTALGKWRKELIVVH